jgi:hypothetical protein
MKYLLALMLFPSIAFADTWAFRACGEPIFFIYFDKGNVTPVQVHNMPDELALKILKDVKSGNIQVFDLNTRQTDIIVCGIQT